MRIVFRFRFAAAFAACLCCALFLSPGAVAQGEQKIVVLVNDSPISAFDVSQRIRFMEVSTRQKRSAQMRKTVIAILVDEELQFQEAKRSSVVVRPDQVANSLAGIGKRNGMTADQLLQAFRKVGVGPKTVRRRVKAAIAWRQVIQKKFRRQVRIGDSQVDRALSNVTASGPEKAQFGLQRVRLEISGGAGQKAIAERFVEAERLRSRFSSCKSMKSLVKSVRKTSVKDVGRKSADEMPQPIRAFLVKAEPGQMTPPNITSSGVELYAVCEKRLVKSDKKQRRQAHDKLAQQEYQILAQRLLRDLRQDAFIEYR